LDGVCGGATVHHDCKRPSDEFSQNAARSRAGRAVSGTRPGAIRGKVGEKGIQLSIVQNDDSGSAERELRGADVKDTVADVVDWYVVIRLAVCADVLAIATEASKARAAIMPR
jgi:hypothetical protein